MDYRTVLLIYLLIGVALAVVLARVNQAAGTPFAESLRLDVRRGGKALLPEWVSQAAGVVLLVVLWPFVLLLAKRNEGQ